MSNEQRTIQTAFERASARRRRDGFAHLGAGALSLGCETRTVAAEYRWDGWARGDDPRHPRVLFQTTLGGAGCFEKAGRSWSVGTERAFLAVLPSKHVYRLPEESAGWSFYWFNFGHPYVVARLAALLRQEEPVFPVAAGSELAVRSLSFFEQICRGNFEDGFAEEGAAFEWMLVLERHLHERAHPRSEREAALAAVRQYTLENLRRPFAIEELAKREGRSRSHYSHQFSAVTGLAPAAYVLEIRLAEARRLLRERAEPLKEIAAATGFADANHFCKAFRRLYHLSPGAYRRQMR